MDKKEFYGKLYKQLTGDLYELFVDKSTIYDYSYFNNDEVTMYFDIKRKFDRIRVLLEPYAMSGTIPDEVINKIEIEKEDLANYALMWMVSDRARHSEKKIAVRSNETACSFCSYENSVEKIGRWYICNGCISRFKVVLDVPKALPV